MRTSNYGRTMIVRENDGSKWRGPFLCWNLGGPNQEDYIAIEKFDGTIVFCYVNKVRFETPLARHSEQLKED